MAKSKDPRKPVGSDYHDKRDADPGVPLVDNADPNACLIRPVTIKLVGMPPFEGELQGTLAHVQTIAGKYRTYFGSLCEWIKVEGKDI